MRNRTTRSALELAVWASTAAVAMLIGIVQLTHASADRPVAGGGVLAVNVVTVVLVGLLLVVAAGLGGLRWRRTADQPAARRLLDQPAARRLVSTTLVSRTERRQVVSTRDRAEAAKIVAAIDSERRRIERDLHDGAQQGFVQAALMLGLAADQLRDTEHAEVVELIDSSIETLRTALGELRDLSRGVYPFLLSHEGLVPAVQALVGRSVVPIALSSDPLPRLDPELEVTAYFVIAEAVTNALKHARATQITVDIRWSGSRLTLSVTDDGVGLADAAGGSGLHGLRTRVTSVGGTLQTRSTPGFGSTVMASFHPDDQPDARRSPDA